jgi:hypothetical protein
MTTRQRVLGLLRGPVVARIYFAFPFFAGTVTITPVSFLRVARAIERGEMRLIPPAFSTPSSAAASTRTTASGRRAP